MDLLKQADSLIHGDRKDSYGDTFPTAAKMWSAYLGHEVTPADVCVCMSLLKLSRESFKHNHDNLLDAIGYIALADEQKDKETNNA